TYRLLLNLAAGKAGGGRATLPLDQVEERWKWWRQRNRTEAWAERYGGRIDIVRNLFKTSRNALVAEQRREQQAKRTAKELARQKEEAALRERKNLQDRAEQQSALAEQQAKLARTRAITNKIISLVLVVALVAMAVALWGLR